MVAETIILLGLLPPPLSRDLDPAKLSSSSSLLIPLLEWQTGLDVLELTPEVTDWRLIGGFLMFSLSLLDSRQDMISLSWSPYGVIVLYP